MIELKPEYPNFEEFLNNITDDGENNFNYIDADKFDKRFAWYSAIKDTCEFQLNKLLCIMCGGFNREGTSSQALATIFMQNGIPENIFADTDKKSGISFDAEHKAMLENYLLNSELKSDAINVYLSYQYFIAKAKAAFTISNVNNGLSDGYIYESDIKGYNNSRLYQVRNCYVQQTTGRFYTRDLNLIGLPLPMRQTTTVPKNYFMLSADLRQIDIRVAYNMYLRGYYFDEDALFDAEQDDKYLAIYKIACMRAKSPIDEKYFQENRDGLKTAILSAMYSAPINTITNNAGDRDTAQAIYDYFHNHALYTKCIDRITKLYNLNIPFIVRDYFGREIDIEKCPADAISDSRRLKAHGKDPTQRYKLEEVVKLCISRTVQSTSYSILVNWTNKVCEKLRDAGIDDSMGWPSLVRHDEDIFTFHVSAIPKLGALFNALEIRIPGWDVITFKTQYYIHYEEDKNFFEGEEEILEKYKTQLAEVQANTQIDNIPVGKLLPVRTIPLAFDLYVFSVDPPEVLVSKLYAGTVDTMTREQAVRFMEEKAEYLGQQYSNYKDLYDIFVIKSYSGEEKAYKGLDGVGAVCQKFGIEYLNGHTVFGSGLTFMGECVVSYNELAPKETQDIIRKAAKVYADQD